MQDVTQLLEWRSSARDDVAEPERGELAAALSNMAVHVLRQHTGRGPSRARTYMHGDLAVVLMKETFTTAERTLLVRGHAELVLRTREALGAAMRDDLITGARALTGRDVVACMTNHHVDPDVSAAIFLLGPATPGDGR